MNGGSVARAGANRTLLAAILASVVMLFTAFAAAYLERVAARGWSRIDLPQILWLTTGLLLASSVTLELARRRGLRVALYATLVLGGLFLAGQYAAWLQLRADGVFLPTSPHGSFFYLLTAVHGLHVLAGLAALVVARARPAALGLCAAFWHLMGAMWVYVLIVLAVF
ncbi:MAG: cytochrome c oxidase subunit 3 [Planctomycetota bacterium]|jgi:cytochrome c oxidase subunit 3